MKNEPKILFTQGTAPFVLEALGYHIENGLIMDSTTNEPIKTYEGKTLKAKRLGAITKGKDGKPLFFMDDLHSIMDLVKMDN